jgi:hypothetical protein
MDMPPKHLNDGEIRTYQDGELDPAGRQRVEAHLAGCLACQDRVNLLAARAHRLFARIDGLQAAGRPNPLPLRLAHRRLEQRLEISSQEKQTMLNKLSSRLSRPVLAAITIVAVLAVALAFPPVRAMANDFLQLFRVKQVQVIPVDMENMSNLDSSANLQALFSKNVNVDKKGEPQEVADAAAASAQAGIPVRLPEKLGQPDRLYVQPGGHMSFTIDLALMRGVLKDLGQTNIDLPDSLDGQTVAVTIPAGVVALYGDCPKPDTAEHPAPGGPDGEMGPRQIPDCTSFMQIPSPDVAAPQELDIPKLGQAYLQVLGMSPDEAAQFASKVDWTSTFVVPVPRNSTNQKDVTVDGVQGTLIRYRQGPQLAYALLWVKDGTIYALTGPGDGQTALDITSSLK